MRLIPWILGACVIAVVLAGRCSGRPAAVRLTRGPILQMATATGVWIVWNTDRPAGSRVDYGLRSYTTSVSDPRPVTRHQVHLSPLQPGRRYAFRIASGGRTLRQGGWLDANKPPGVPFRFAVFGDSGSGDRGQYLLAARIAAAHPDFLVHTGDVVYPDGAQSDYDSRFFRPYASLLEHMVLWPTLGNHDLKRAGGRAYLENFILPRNGPPGLPTEHNYSFDYADAHFTAIDSNAGDESLGKAVAPWLRRDLAATRRLWKFVFFHHPPYSSARHGENARIQRWIVPALTSGHADIVFNGHDHAYERTRPIGGVTYIVTGAGGAGLYERRGTHPYTARFYNRSWSFTLVDVDGSRLRLRQIAADGAVVDECSLRK